MFDKKIAFFTEAGTKRGLGHLVRSYAIADYFKKMGSDVEFYLDSDIDVHSTFNYIDFKWKDILTIDKNFDVCFIDSYEASLVIYQKLSSFSRETLYIDDFERLNYPKGIVINFAPDADKLFFKTRDTKQKYLLGIEYLPIREIFKQYKGANSKEYILIILGGMDIKNLSFEIVDSLKKIKLQKVLITSNKNNIKEMKTLENCKIVLNPDADTLAKTMAEAKVAISTASMTLYELSFLQIPTVVITVSQNQSNGLEQFIRWKICQDYVDVTKTNYKKELFGKVKNLIDSHTKILTPIDGKGIERIYDFTKETYK